MSRPAKSDTEMSVSVNHPALCMHPTATITHLPSTHSTTTKYHIDAVSDAVSGLKQQPPIHCNSSSRRHDDVTTTRVHGCTAGSFSWQLETFVVRGPDDVTGYRRARKQYMYRNLQNFDHVAQSPSHVTSRATTLVRTEEQERITTDDLTVVSRE